MMKVAARIATSVLLLQLLLASTSAKDQALCRAVWLFKMPCTEIASALVNQVNIWSSQHKCSDMEEKCMYEIVKTFPSYLEIKHTSRNSYKTSVITFDFDSPAAPFFCKMRATSKASQNTTIPNDYCLIYNLISGSGLTHRQGYKEICTETMCPSKRIAMCSEGMDTEEIF